MKTTDTMYVIQAHNGLYHTNEPMLRWTKRLACATLYSTHELASFQLGRLSNSYQAQVLPVQLSLEAK